MTILLSGGSRGLGLAMVQHLLQRGQSVATFARSATPAMQTLAAKHPGKFLFQPLDATDAAAVKKFVADAEAKLGPITGLVNNAAVGQDHLLIHMAEEDIDRILAINLRGPFLLTKAVLRKMMLRQDGGRIVNVSSICGSRGFTGLTIYSATKGALDAFTRSLAREVGSRGILVNSLAPGFFSSEMSEVLSEEQMDVIRRRTPTGTLSEPRHILKALDYLLFEADNVTGQVLAVDGGSSI
jgi:3-oxoacyl-[acyl-carrier protein] reductase